MAHFEMTRSGMTAGAPVSPIARTLRSILPTLRVALERRATRRALSQLTDRELDDIGLCRGDIARIVALHR